jgi:hypothetical protein
MNEEERSYAGFWRDLELPVIVDASALDWLAAQRRLSKD